MNINYKISFKKSLILIASLVFCNFLNAELLNYKDAQNLAQKNMPIVRELGKETAIFHDIVGRSLQYSAFDKTPYLPGGDPFGAQWKDIKNYDSELIEFYLNEFNNLTQKAFEKGFNTQVKAGNFAIKNGLYDAISTGLLQLLLIKQLNRQRYDQNNDPKLILETLQGKEPIQGTPVFNKNTSTFDLDILRYLINDQLSFNVNTTIENLLEQIQNQRNQFIEQTTKLHGFILDLSTNLSKKADTVEGKKSKIDSILSLIKNIIIENANLNKIITGNIGRTEASLYFSSIDFTPTKIEKLIDEVNQNLDVLLSDSTSIKQQLGSAMVAYNKNQIDESALNSEIERIIKEAQDQVKPDKIPGLEKYEKQFPNLLTNPNEIVQGKSVLHVAVTNKDLNAVKEILNIPNSNINVQTPDKVTALHFAVFSNLPEIAKYLIDSGIDKSIKKSSGETALDQAIRLNRVEIIKLLQ